MASVYRISNPWTDFPGKAVQDSAIWVEAPDHGAGVHLSLHDPPGHQRTYLLGRDVSGTEGDHPPEVPFRRLQPPLASGKA